MFEMTLDGLYVLIFMVLVFPVIVLIAWAVIQGVQKGARLWRALAVGLLASAGTVGALVAWWYVVGGLVPLSFAEDLSIVVWVLGLFIIPIIGVSVGIWIVLRVARAPNALASVDG